jgi:intracellular sulfur oxidation DsrE/DsrF family protein
MNSFTLNIFLQVAMVACLLMVAYLMIMPVIAGIVRSAKLSAAKLPESRSVLEVVDSRNDTQRMVLTRLKNMLENNPAAKLEVVARDEGINLLLQYSAHKQAIQTLIQQGVLFTACQKSLQRLSKQTAIQVDILPGVRLIPDGKLYAEQLKNDGYIDELA